MFREEIALVLPMALLILYMLMNEEKRYYVYMFTADWCVFCRQMRKDSWPHSSVKEIIKTKYKNRMYFLDEADPEAKKYFEKFKPTALPETIIVDNKGNVIRRKVGKMSANALADFLKR